MSKDKVTWEQVDSYAEEAIVSLQSELSAVAKEPLRDVLCSIAKQLGNSYVGKETCEEFEDRYYILLKSAVKDRLIQLERGDIKATGLIRRLQFMDKYLPMFEYENGEKY